MSLSCELLRSIQGKEFERGDLSAPSERAVLNKVCGQKTLEELVWTRKQFDPNKTLHLVRLSRCVGNVVVLPYFLRYDNKSIYKIQPSGPNDLCKKSKPSRSFLLTSGQIFIGSADTSRIVFKSGTTLEQIFDWKMLADEMNSKYPRREGRLEFLGYISPEDILNIPWEEQDLYSLYNEIMKVLRQSKDMNPQLKGLFSQYLVRIIQFGKNYFGWNSDEALELVNSIQCFFKRPKEIPASDFVLLKYANRDYRKHKDENDRYPVIDIKNCGRIIYNISSQSVTDRSSLPQMSE